MNNTSVMLDGSALAEPGLAPNKVVERFKTGLDGSNGEVALDLRSLNKITSMGITLVIGLHKECANRRRKFSILLADNEVPFLLKTLKLDRVLELRIEDSAA